MLLVLASLWGASFMFIKVGVRELHPTTLVCLRLGIGALTLLPLLLVRIGVRESARLMRASLGPLVLTGLVNSAIPIVSIAWAEKRLDSGLTAVIQAAAPLFTALLALAFVRSERVTGLRLVGLLAGFAGVALLVGAQPSGELTAALAVVFSALSVGALTTATLALLPLALTHLPPHFPSWKVTGAVLALAVGGTGVAYLLYYALLAGAGASRSILVTYLVPALALAYGALFLGEPLTAAAVAGLALVLGGVALGTGALLRRTNLDRCGRRSAEPSLATPTSSSSSQTTTTSSRS